MAESLQNYISNLSYQELNELSENDLLEIDSYLSFSNRSFELAENYHLNTHKERLTFESRLYLIDIYTDDSEYKVVRKSVQCGISESLITKAFSYSENGYSVLYVLPKFDLRNKFVLNRVDTLLTLVPEYRKLLKEAIGESDSRGLKHFGLAAINFVGSNSPDEFIEYPADLVIVDELDRCDQKNIVLAGDRLDNSKLKHVVKVSTPTYENYGIDQEYLLTDQKEWNIKCLGCGEWQKLEWIGNVVGQIDKYSYELLELNWDKENEIKVFCKSCNNEIDRLGNGEWIPKDKEKDRSGYHVSQLFTQNNSIKVLWELFQEAMGNESLLRIFFNSKLGVSYSPEGTQFNEVALNECIRNYIIPTETERDIYCGIDVGKRIHYVFLEHMGTEIFRLVDVGSVSEFEELKDIKFSQWKPKYSICDIEPEVRKAKEFRDKNENVWLCDYFGRTEEATTTNEPKVDKREKIINVDRTQTLDTLFSKFATQDIWLPKNVRVLSPIKDGKSELYYHLNNLIRVVEETQGKKQRAFWRDKGEDHLVHCLNYALLGFWIMRNHGIPQIH